MSKRNRLSSAISYPILPGMFLFRFHQHRGLPQWSWIHSPQFSPCTLPLERSEPRKERSGLERFRKTPPLPLEEHRNDNVLSHPRVPILWEIQKSNQIVGEKKIDHEKLPATTPSDPVRICPLEGRHTGGNVKRSTCSPFQHDLNIHTSMHAVRICVSV